MKKPTLAQKTNLNNMVVTAGCKVQAINENTMKWETIGEIVYTPYAINQFMKQNKLTNVWVNLFGDRQMWFASKGNLATK